MRERTLSVLIREGLVGPGTAIVVHGLVPGARWPTVFGGRGRTARFGDDLSIRENVVWDLDDQGYSLTALRNLLIDKGAPYAQGLAYQHWALADRPEISLWDLAEEAGRASPST